MARRSSARLRNRNSSTPKRVSLSHDAPTRTPQTAPVKLAALQENDEMPGAFPRSVSPPSRLAPSVVKQDTTTIPVKFDDTTPKNVTPIKPSEEEMHPKQHQQSTAKPLEEARWLGFANMGPHTEPAKHSGEIATLQGTPTRVPKASCGTASPKFDFTFRREQSLELSPEAKKLMNEKRQEAARIREQMLTTGEGLEGFTSAAGRKMATPKGKKGRFSAAHMEQFKKMDSIAGHASAFRVDPARTKKSSTPTHTPGTMRDGLQDVGSPSKSLKRKPSAAQLDEQDQPRPSAIPRSVSKPTFEQKASHMPASMSSKTKLVHGPIESVSPAKRVKRTATEYVPVIQASRANDESVKPATPQHKDYSQAQAVYPDLAAIASPTQASLARAASIKSIKSSMIPGPSLSRSPSKPILLNAKNESPNPSTPLLARSPSKGPPFTNSIIDKPKLMMSPLFKRSPPKFSTHRTSEHKDNEDPTPKEAPLLARSPLKMSVSKRTESEAADDKPASSVPLLAQSPAKFSMPFDNTNAQSVQITNKSSNNSLMGRFNLLRSSPMKSILRSPQRLYSDDPAKVAAGTHLATPPKFRPDANNAPSTQTAATAPVQKHVDFSSSTKARYERAQSEISSTPSKGSSPEPESDTKCNQPAKPTFADYPTLPSNNIKPILTPQKRRQTVAPGDFTFRAGEHSITFGQSPSAPSSVKSSHRSSTIRHVSAEPQLPPTSNVAPATGTKKRKFDFENDKAVDEEMSGTTSDKENGGEGESERPAKRAKPSAPEPAPSKPATRPPTLGVKPKKTDKSVKEKKPSTISMARLNALAQPKRRV